MSILPGDTIRLNITGSDSTILVDSWNSALKGPVVGSDNTTLVDTVNNVLLGKHEGELAGNVTATNGSVVLNSGTNGTDAVFIGDVTGDVVGDLFGDVTGNVQGDILDEQENVMLDATNRTLTVDRINTQSINLGNLEVSSLSVSDITAGTFNGPLLGDVSGQHFGNVYGDVEGSLVGDTIGDHTGDVIGRGAQTVVDTSQDIAEFYGNLNGDVVGNVNGNVVGDVVGNITGDITGNVTGNIQGDLLNAAGTHIGLSVTAEGNVSLATNNNGSLSFGAVDDTLTINANYREYNDFVVIPHPSGPFAQRRMHYNRVNADGKAKVIPGDLLDLRAILAYNGTEYKTAGHWGYAVDPNWTVPDNANSIKTIFGVSVADGTNQPDVLGPKKLSVDGQGTVGGYAFKAHPINSTERNALSATAGMIIFNSSTNKFQGYNGNSWVDLG